MSILPKLATSLSRRDEVPNQELAEHIVRTADANAVNELIENLSNKNKAVRHDCIKVLYEIANLQPGLVSGHYKSFISLLDDTDNRLQWGAMTALNAMVKEKPEAIFKALPKLVEVAKTGTVITRDNFMAILLKLCRIEKYATAAFPLFIEQLKMSAVNQLPMYAENALPIIHLQNKDLFVKTLSSRLNDIEKETKKCRVEKVIAKVNKIRS